MRLPAMFLFLQKKQGGREGDEKAGGATRSMTFVGQYIAAQFKSPHREHF
jgi:hypothetical protein